MPTSSCTASSVFKGQKAFFESGRSRDPAYCRDRLKSLATQLEKRSEDALVALHADLGKPALEAWLAEIHFVQADLKHCLRNLRRWQKPERARNPFYFWPARSEIRREPFGQVLITSPWNYPLQLSLSPLISAVAAGNCVTLKPSEYAPATSSFLADLIASVFDPGHVSLIEGGPATGARLLELPFHFFCYTGGEKTGRLYAEAGAAHLAPVILELGGKCPCLIDNGVDLKRAAERIVSGKFFNAGQTCIAPDFVALPSTSHDEFLHYAENEIRSCYGTTPGPDLARIINHTHYQRLLDLLPPDALCIGEDQPGNLSLAPRLLPNTSWASPPMQEEIFGPILPVVSYGTLDEALNRIRELPTPLALYFFSPDRQQCEIIADSLPSGAVCFNDVMKTGTNHFLPMGGLGRSGMGRYRGLAGFENFTYQRPVTRRWLGKDPFLVKAPYQGKLERLRKFLRF